MAVPKIDKRATAGKANNTASSNGAVIGSTKPAIVVQEPTLDSRSSEEPTVQPEETRDIEDAQVISELSLCCDINTITPSIYDELLPWMHSSSIARYAQDEGKTTTDASSQTRLTAATPTRIIAQITSDTFMDYELVSDFFLTFRPYLDAQKLVHLLFARLEWSMDRHTADGRIVRIRTFAALRHWVLNYFADDFLHEHSGLELRKAFCGRLNGLYRKMKNHMEAVTAQGGREGTETSQAAIASDLKVLVDLKRCWNGRCAFFRDCFEKACKHEDSHLNMGEESFNADEDVMYNWSPSGTRYVSDDGAHPAVERTRLGRFNDTRFSYYGAYLPNDRLPLSTEIASASKLSSKSHPLLNERMHQDGGDMERNRSAVAPSRKQDCTATRDIGHAKSNSQGSNASVKSAGLSRRGYGHTPKNSGSFSDSTRHNVSQIRRSLSLKAKDHGDFPYDLVPFERQRYDSQRAVLKNKDEARVVVPPMLRLEESDPLPEQLQDKDSNDPAEIPKDTHIPYRQGMIHGLKEHVYGVDKKINDFAFGALGDESQDDKRSAAPPATAYPKSEASITASHEPGDNSERPKSKVNFQEVRPESSSILHSRPLSRRAPPVTNTRRNMTVPTMTTTITADPMPDNSHGPFARRLRNRWTKDETAMNLSSIEPPSTTPGVKNLVGTIRRAFVDRKQVHDGNETMRSASAGTPAAAGLGILRTNSQSKTRYNQHNDTIADKFFRKRTASQSTSRGLPIQSGPTRQKSKEFKQGLEHDLNPLSSRNNSLLDENSGHDDTSSQNAKTFGTKTPPQTATGLMSGPSFGSSPQKGGSADTYSPQDADHIRWHRIVADEVIINGQLMPFLLPPEPDKRKSVLEWLDSHNDPRVDILAEYAAQAYRYHLFFQHEKHIQESASMTMASAYDLQDAQSRVPDSTVLGGPEAISFNLLVPSPSDTKQARDTDRAQVAPQSHNDASNPDFSSQIHGEEASRASCYARTECGSDAYLDERQPNLVHSKAISSFHAGLGLNVDISSSEHPLGNAFSGLTNRASVLTVPAMEVSNSDREISAGQGKTSRHASASYDGPVLEPTKSEPARAVSGNAFHRLSYQPSVSTRLSCQDELSAREQVEDGGMVKRASNCNFAAKKVVDLDAGKAGHFLQVTNAGQPQSNTGNNTIARGGWAVTRGMKSFGNKLRKYASYQSGMSKFGHATSNDGLQLHEGRGLQESDGAVGPPPMSRSRSIWGIGRRRQDASEAVDKQTHGRILSHHPLNVSSFDVHAKIEECDREGAFSPMPNLPHIPPPPSVSSSSPSPSLLSERAAPGEEGDAPVYTLRRRPGGDLRHAQNVHDLVVQHVPSETPTSLGSSFSNSPYDSRDFTHFSKVEGTGESSFLEPENTGFVHDESEEAKDGSIAQESELQFQDASDDQVGFIPVSEFTNAADGDDGGVESTLLKLEGKWTRKPPTASRTKETFSPRSSFDSDDSLPGLDEKRHRRQQKVVDSVESLEQLSVASDYVSEAAGSRTERASSLASMYFNEGEEDDQPPTHARQSEETADETEASQTHDNDSDNSPDGIESANTSKYLSASSKFSPAPVNASNLSSQVASEPSNECGENGFGYGTTSIAQADGESSSQTPYQTPLERPEKSSYSSKIDADGALDRGDSQGSDKAHESNDNHQGTLQPCGEDSSLVGASVHPGFGPPLAVRKYPHAPFILAYDPKVLVEQFTLVEIAALGEIDWRDLVDMNWSNEQSTLNWADYLATDGRRGIDIVVARFNLM
ncbi:Guanine nucleotide exchange factor lte1, partial [Ascosphaera atra]